MNENQMRVIKMIEEQQKALDEYTPTRMVGEQLKDICRAEPESAELLEQDLQKKGMGLADAEKMIRARADEIHKNMKGTGVVVPPWEAEDILRKFYGLPERTWGPGKEKADSSAARDGAFAPYGAQNDKLKGSIIELTDFF